MDCVIVPIHKLPESLKFMPFFIISPEPSFFFSICLRVVSSRRNVFNSLGVAEYSANAIFLTSLTIFFEFSVVALLNSPPARILREASSSQAQTHFPSITLLSCQSICPKEKLCSLWYLQYFLCFCFFLSSFDIPEERRYLWILP